MNNIPPEVMEELKLVFVTRKECVETNDEITRKLNRDYADLSVIKFQLKLILGILSAVGVAVLSLVINQVWRG